MANTTTKKAAAKKPAPQKQAPAPKATDTLPARDADQSLEDLFLGGLKDMYWAEQHLVAALPKMVAATSNSDLSTALTAHLEVTKTHVQRLEEAFGLLGADPLPKKCAAMEGLTISGENCINETARASAAREMGIVQSGLKVENFEITAYTGLINLANTLDQTDIAQLLTLTLEEEQASAGELTAIGDSL